ncbi:MAG: FxsA family protein, partial [Myxococcota bacterium]
MWWLLVLLFTVVPALELYLLLQIGSWIGPTPTFLMLLVTGVAGAWLAKREGFALLGQLSAELQRGLPPGDRVVEGVLVLVGGLLLITPGVLTDVAGVLLIVRPTRRWLAPRLMRGLSGRFSAPEVEEGPGDGVKYRTDEPPRVERAP